MNASVNDEWTLTVRVLCEPHFLQTLARKSNLAIRCHAIGTIFHDVTLCAVAKKIARLAET